MNRIIFILLLLPCFAGAQIITTVAGSGSIMSYSGDGAPATAATMSKTFGMAKDAAGNIYVADFDNNRVRKIDPSGIITTFAGNGTAAYSGDGGPATAASLHGPVGLAFYGGNLYITDNLNYRTRKVDAAGIITTIAGNGTNGYGGDGGPATAAKISRSHGVEMDGAGNIYITDLDNARIRKVDPSGTITTFAGTGISGYSGNGVPATSAQLDWPDDIKIDATGNLYFCDFRNDVVRKINTSGIITTIAGTGVAGYSGDGGSATAAKLRGPDGVLPDAFGNIYISDLDNNRLRMINPSGVITTVAGTGTAGFSGDGGLAIAATINGVNDMIIDAAGDLYFCDFYNYRVRKISPPPGDNNYLSSQLTLQSQTSVHPNPVSEFLNLSCSISINRIAIANLDGKLVYSSRYDSHEVRINVADLPVGIYFVTINGTETKEFIKK